MIGIYKIVSPTSKVYIGQSVDIEKRWKAHKCSKYKSRLNSSLKKHGFENHTFEVIEECTIEQLNERERFWQDYYDVLGPNGLNLILQGTELKRKTYSTETRKRLGLVNLGRKRSQETIDKLKGPHSEERRRRNSEAQKRYQSTVTQEQKERKRKLCSESNLDRVSSELSRAKSRESKLGGKNPLAKKVINTLTGEIFLTIRLAAKSINKKDYYLRGRLKGIYKNNTNLKYYEGDKSVIK